MSNPIKNAPVVSIEIKTAACLKFAEENNYSTSQASEIAEHCSIFIDGYGLSKDLESYCSWDIDVQTVEDLDMVSDYIRTELKKARKKWFIDNDIQPPFKIGSKLKQGIIHDIWNHDVAYYRVKETGCTVDSRFLLIKFEDAKLEEIQSNE